MSVALTSSKVSFPADFRVTLKLPKRPTRTIYLVLTDAGYYALKKAIQQCNRFRLKWFRKQFALLKTQNLLHHPRWQLRRTFQGLQVLRIFFRQYSILDHVAKFYINNKFLKDYKRRDLPVRLLFVISIHI